MGKKGGKTQQQPESDQEEDQDEVLDLNDPRILAALRKQMQQGSSISSLPADVQRRVKALKNLQIKHASLNAAYEKEVAALELKYAALHQPLFAQRATIVGGSYEPTDEEATFEDDDEEEEEEESKDAKKDDKPAEPVKGIPNFWLTVLQNSDLIADKIQQHDVPVLEHLTDITVELNAQAGTGFKISFFFSENEFFTDAVLTKTYTIDLGEGEGVVMYEGPSFSKTEGCEIHWKAGKNVTVKAVKKKQKKKGGKDAGAVRVVTKLEKVASFFNLFTPPAEPKEGDPNGQETIAALEEDFEIGDTIREKLVPNAVLWFTGEALDYEDGYNYGEDGEDGDFGGDDDEDDDEDGDGDSKAKSKGPAPGAAPGAAGAKPECKQS